MANTQIKRLYFDIETSLGKFYSWKAGWKINIPHDNIIEEPRIICICWKWNNSDTVHSLDWGKAKDDKKLLKKFIKVANKADQMIGHNGDKFDLKWIKTRCLFHRIETFPKYQTFDTLTAVRSNFRLQSNRLDYISKFLGFSGKSETGGLQLWRDCDLGVDGAVQKMVDYCKKDVVILEQVFDAINNYVPHKTHSLQYTELPTFSCPECGSVKTRCNKTRTTAAGTIRRQMHCVKCKKIYTISNKAYIDLLKWRMINQENK
jgi:DNA polymerase elongation subunit (family B)